MSVRVERADGLVTLQDHGRRGLAHLGVPTAGALDRSAAELANRLVGNDPAAAVLETTMLGVTLVPARALTVAVTGAPCPVVVDGRPRAHSEPVTVRAGARVEVGAATAGLRSYVAVAGGFDVPMVLGSRSTDTLAWIGPPRVVAGAVLPVGRGNRPRPADTGARAPRSGPLEITRGPRLDWFAAEAWSTLVATAYAVTGDSNRVGLRLRGAPLVRARTGELPSEGMVAGAVQVPPDGQPVVLLRDHPTTGGYPVVAVVAEPDLARCAQLRPGEQVRFTAQRPGRA